MKFVRTIPVFVLMLFATQSAGAQLNLGVLGGVNSSNFKVDVDQPIAVPLPGGGSELGSFSSRTSFTIGGVAEYYFSPTVGLSVQPMYSQQGGEFEFDGPVAAPHNSETTTKLSYIDIPVLLKVEAGGATLRPYLLSGFSLAFLTSAKSIGGDETTDIKDSVKGTNASWSIGGGVNLPASGKTVFIEGRYQVGLKTINEGPPQPELFATTTEFKTKGFLFVAGVTFPVGNR